MNLRARARALVALAADERTPIDEARNAALQACRLISKENLLEGHDEVSTPREETVIVRVPLVVLLETSKLYRLAAIEIPKRHTDKVMILPKEFASDIEFMTPRETKNIGWGTSTITKSITIKKSYFEIAVQQGWHYWR